MDDVAKTNKGFGLVEPATLRRSATDTILTGIAFKIAADKVESETEILWMREMISGAYQPHCLTMFTEKGPVRGFTFVVNRKHDRYLGGLNIEDTAKAISEGEGQLGSCRDYLMNTVIGLLDLGIQDSYLKRLQKVLGDP